MSVMHERRAGLGGLRNEYARGPLRYGPSGSENRLLRQMVFQRGCAWGSQVPGLRGIFYRAVRESVTSARRGTRDVPNKSSVQKSYTDIRPRPLEFEVGDHVFLKVMPKRGVIRFNKRDKLSLRYIGPFEILERLGTVAYRLTLPPSLSSVHAVFHVSMLQKYTPDPTRGGLGRACG